MIVLKGKNVNYLLPQGVALLKECGQKVSPRGMETLEAPCPVSSVYGNPCERVLFDPVRDANPFFHFMEGLWIIAGRNDVRWLAQFNKNMENYSDDGKTFHGAYGHRLRNNGWDQIDEVIGMLEKDPTTRRAVLQMWDFKKDLNAVSKDIPCNDLIMLKIRSGKLNMTVCNRSNDIVWGCLSGDTPILSPEGAIPIKELSDQFKSGKERFPVYAVDEKTGDKAIKWCVNAWSTGTKPIIELKFDNGTSLKLTKNHILYKKTTKRGVYNTPKNIVPIEAGELCIGDRIWAPRIGLNKGTFKKNILRGAVYSNTQKISRAYAKFLWGRLPKNSHVHHKNENDLDNRSENIQVNNKSDHMSHHMSKRNLSFSEEERSKRAKHASIKAYEAIDSMTEHERKEFYHTRSSKAKLAYWEKLTHEERLKITEPGRTKITENMQNHKIIEIVELPPEEVFDFTVEDYHTALIGDGILAHNCYGANAVHFSMLQEYIASMVGVEVGTYTQVSDSYHVYTDNPYYMNGEFTQCLDPYLHQHINPFPLVSATRSFDAELRNFFEYNGIVTGLWANSIFTDVAMPMYDAWFAHKLNKSGAEHALQIEATDWRMACLEWLERRGDIQ